MEKNCAISTQDCIDSGASESPSAIFLSHFSAASYFQPHLILFNIVFAVEYIAKNYLLYNRLFSSLSNGKDN